jgi:hypothetical protein
MPAYGMRRSVDLVRNNVSEEGVDSIFRAGKYASEESVRRITDRCEAV